MQRKPKKWSSDYYLCSHSHFSFFLHFVLQSCPPFGGPRCPATSRAYRTLPEYSGYFSTWVRVKIEPMKMVKWNRKSILSKNKNWICHTFWPRTSCTRSGPLFILWIILFSSCIFLHRFTERAVIYRISSPYMVIGGNVRNVVVTIDFFSPEIGSMAESVSSRARQPMNKWMRPFWARSINERVGTLNTIHCSRRFSPSRQPLIWPLNRLLGKLMCQELHLRQAK